MTIEEKLIEKGYKKYTTSSLCFQYAEYFYQKKITDSVGVKYFIEFVCYKGIDKAGPTWMCHLNVNEPHMTFEQHRIKDVEDAENKCEKFWYMIVGEYYEKFNDVPF